MKESSVSAAKTNNRRQNDGDNAACVHARAARTRIAHDRASRLPLTAALLTLPAARAAAQQPPLRCPSSRKPP